jgi:toxin ParE1/3/4
MMARIILTRAAKADLLEIWTFIAVENESAADRLLDRLYEAIENLALHPYLGRERPELAAGLRSHPVERYILFYQPQPDAIEVARVLHSSRDIGAFSW